MKRKFRGLAISLCCTLLLGFAAACSNKSAESPTTSSTTAPATSSTTAPATNSSAAASPTPAATPKFDPMAKYDPPITVKVGFALTATDSFNGNETIDDNVWRDLYGQYGINLDNMYNVDISQKDQKLRTTIASGDYPDIFSIYPQDLQKYATTGVIADLSDLYDKYLTPDMDAYYKSDGETALNATKVNGKLYGLPFLSSPWDYIDLLWIRTDWLQNLGLEPPKTMDDLEKIALAFTKDDPDKDGKNDTYGIVFNGTQPFGDSGIHSFFEGFGAYPQAYVKNPNGEDIIFGGDLPGMNDGLTMLQRMYKDGSLRSDFATMDSTKVQEDVQAGKVGIWFGPAWINYYYTALPKNFPKSDILSMQIPTETAGVPAKLAARSTLGYINVVSSKFKNPEAIFKMWNLVWEKFNSKDLEEHYKYFGGKDKTKGVQEYELAILDARAPNGTIDNYRSIHEQLVGDKPVDPLNKATVDSLKAYDKAREDGTYDPANNATDAGNWVTKTYWDGGWKTVQLFDQGNYMPAIYNGPTTEAMSKYAADIQQAMFTEMDKIIIGAKPVSDWDNFMQNTYMKQGGTAILKDMNDWLQSTK